MSPSRAAWRELLVPSSDLPKEVRFAPLRLVSSVPINNMVVVGCGRFLVVGSRFLNLTRKTLFQPRVGSNSIQIIKLLVLSIATVAKRKNMMSHPPNNLLNDYVSGPGAPQSTFP
jgi:hypothetical protein